MCYPRKLYGRYFAGAIRAPGMDVSGPAGDDLVPYYCALVESKNKGVIWSVQSVRVCDLSFQRNRPEHILLFSADEPCYLQPDGSVRSGTSPTVAEAKTASDHGRKPKRITDKVHALIGPMGGVEASRFVEYVLNDCMWTNMLTKESAGVRVSVLRSLIEKGGFRGAVYYE